MWGRREAEGAQAEGLPSDGLKAKKQRPESAKTKKQRPGGPKAKPRPDGLKAKKQRPEGRNVKQRVGLPAYQPETGRRRPRPDATVISFPKSGRTWLSYMYVFYAVDVVLGADAEQFLDRFRFSYQPEKTPAIQELLGRSGRPRRAPRIHFTHRLPGATPYYALNLDLEAARKEWGDALMLLVRDPRDVVVSYYHHARHKGIRGSGVLPEDMTISEFIRSETMGIRAVVEYMNQARVHGHEFYPRFELMTYEQMSADAAGSFVRLLQLARADPIDEAAARRAADRASFERLQALEKERRRDGQTVRIRSGKMGSARDELDPSDLAYLDAVVDRWLGPRFDRYRQDTPGVAGESDSMTAPPSSYLDYRDDPPPPAR